MESSKQLVLGQRVVFKLDWPQTATWLAEGCWLGVRVRRGFAWTTIPTGWHRKTRGRKRVHDKRQSVHVAMTTSNFYLSGFSCERRPFSEWSTYRVYEPECYMWAPCRTARWYTSSFCYVADALFHSGSPYKSKACMSLCYNCTHTTIFQHVYCVGFHSFHSKHSQFTHLYSFLNTRKWSWLRNQEQPRVIGCWKMDWEEKVHMVQTKTSKISWFEGGTVTNTCTAPSGGWWVSSTKL